MPIGPVFSCVSLSSVPFCHSQSCPIGLWWWLSPTGTTLPDPGFKKTQTRYHVLSISPVHWIQSPWGLNKPMAEASQADTGNQHCPKDLLHESLSSRHLRNFSASLVEFEVVSALWSRSLACQHLFGCSATTSTLPAPLHSTFSFLYFWSHLLQSLVKSPKISNWYLVFTQNTIH